MEATGSAIEPNSSRRSSVSTPHLTSQAEKFELARKKKNSEKQRNYRLKTQKTKQALKDQRRLKWENLGGSQKPCMRIYQYDIPVLKRVVQLGTCPTARGSFVPTARIASHMIEFGEPYTYYKTTIDPTRVSR